MSAWVEQNRSEHLKRLTLIAEQKLKNFLEIGASPIPTNMEDAYRLFEIYAKAKFESEEAERELRRARGK